MTMHGSIATARISGPRREADGRVVMEFQFGADDPTFAGHFPTRPLLPGVFQLEMTRAAAEWALDCSLAIREVCRAKFRRPILPSEIVRVDLKLSEEGDTIQARASFSVGGEPAGETVLQLRRSE
jgi:3-hydroxymyristoyl/3-hydroxydecanoyl-(acyl carrier protein) dehydratase